MTRIEPSALETVTGSGTLDEIHDALDAFWRSHPRVPPDVRIRIEIAAAEIGANIVEHAGGGRPVRLRMETRDLRYAVEVVFTDDGPEAHVDLTALGLPGEMAERSRGLALAQSVLAELLYRRRGDTNRWTLISEDFR